MIDLTERADNTGMIYARDHDTQEIRQEGGLFLQVECEGFVVTMAYPMSAHETRIGKCTSYISTLATRTVTSLN